MKVFISYSSKDKSIVRTLASDLKSFDIKVWFDEWEIKAGDSIVQKIQTALSECDFIALWLTNSSIRSGWVEREWQSKYWEEVQTKQIKVLPLMGEKCQIPELLKGKKYADFCGEYSEGFLQLMDVLAPGKSYLITSLVKFLSEHKEAGFRLLDSKRAITIDDTTYIIDALYYHSSLKRHIAFMIKQDKFRAEFKAQMEVCLNWIDEKYNLKLENPSLGMILCAEKSSELIRLLRLEGYNPDTRIYVSTYKIQQSA